ncbi:hypothetical protein PoB_004959600 [Plakobranchus ocellatus]|uniref:Chitin-binding type-2 domain-containing protein n=1 Tax=Plakobranchus ocellatus TaxID=259542 RepID=A0AAV4BRI5_9GAST|nr:hypothetical protein PoB_004959600 [Plakobranchus ocellatus]
MLRSGFLCLSAFLVAAAAAAASKIESSETRASCLEGVVKNVQACSREYRICQEGRWNAAICAVGIFDPDVNTCVLSHPRCPIAKFSPQQRRSLTVERQTRINQQPADCSFSYACPSNLTAPFVYPYWDSCDSYILCDRGVLSILSCRFQNYNYYNPRTMSCEEFATQTNTCVYRLDTDLSPVNT